MNQPLIWLGAAVFFGLVVLKMRRKPKGRVARIREGIEGVLDEAEDVTADLRKRAARLRGDAKRRLQEEAQFLESRQHELRSRLDELKTEATKLFERERAKAKAG